MRWGTMHAGLDFACPTGSPLYASSDGTVVEGKDRKQGSVSGFGSWIWIDCQESEGVDLIYGHVDHSKIRVRKGDSVKAGDLIGYSGNEGETTGPHLHFEVWSRPGRTGGSSVDPAHWLSASSSLEQGVVVGDPIWIPSVLRKAGLVCHEFPGWKNRGHGDFKSIWGIVDHHTGSFGETPNGIANHPSLGLASQLYLGKNGEYTMCGAGIAWHAGAGSWPGIPKNNANSCTIGIEAANDGTSGWSSTQYSSYVKGNAAILNYLGLPSSRSIGHKEWGAIQGKWDPGKIDMNRFRLDIAAAQKGMKAPVLNMINECAKKNPWVGRRLSAEETPCGKDGKGRFVEFEKAHIYWSSSSGAQAIPHSNPEISFSGIYEDWKLRGSELKIGFPIRDFGMIATSSYSGAVQAFQNGSLYIRNGFRATLVGGVIGQRWALEGFEKGDLGWPVTDELDNELGGKIQFFERGSLSWDPSGASKRIGDAAKDLTIVDQAGIPIAVGDVNLSSTGV